MAIIKNPTLMHELIDNMDYMVRVMDEDHNVIYMNKKMREDFGHTQGNICFSLLGREEKCEHCVTKETELTGKPDMKHVPIKDRFYNMISSPVTIDNDEKYSIELFQDLTNEKKIEDSLLKHFEKLKADIEFAKQIQNRVLPVDGTYWGQLEINSIYSPSEDLGGDLFDVIKMNEEETLLYIADVSGHGITSSLVTIFLRQVVRGYIDGDEVDLRELTELLLKSYLELGIGKEQYLTIMFCLYNNLKKEMTFLNAGHNCLPLVVSASGEIREIEISGLPICVLLERVDHKTVTIPVEIGDRIILYTDGITEAFDNNRVPYNSERVLKTVSDNLGLDGKKLAEKIIEEVNAYTQEPAADDMAVLVTKLI